MDLGQMSIQELEELVVRVQREISGRKVKEQEAAVREIRAIAARAGLSLDQLTGKAPRSTKGVKAAVKYRDPSNSENTWSGRGRKPRWLDEALRNGRSIEEFTV